MATLFLTACAAASAPEPPRLAMPAATALSTNRSVPAPSAAAPSAAAPSIVPMQAASCQEAAVFSDANLERAVRRALGGIPGPLEASAVAKIEALQVHFDTATEASLTGIECMQSLTSLTATWREFEEFEGIRGQHVRRMLTNDVALDLGPLAGLTALRELRVVGAQVTNLEPLRGLKRLAVLELTRTRHEHLGFIGTRHGENQFGGSLEVLSALAQLTELRLDHAGLLRLDGLAGLTELRVLALANNHLSDLAPLTPLRKLEKLILSGNRAIANLSPLLSLPALTSLEAYSVADCTHVAPALAQLRAKGVIAATHCP